MCCKRFLILSVLFFSFFPSGISYGQESVRERIQGELVTLEIQLNSSALKISDLQKQLQDTKQKSESFIASLKEQLRQQQETYMTLSKQYEGLKSYLKRLETENKVLWVSLGVVVVGGILYGLFR
jgi:septal ring factor EnvC (AmiA/AmiB activator)